RDRSRHGGRSSQSARRRRLRGPRRRRGWAPGLAARGAVRPDHRHGQRRVRATGLARPARSGRAAGRSVATGRHEHAGDPGAASPWSVGLYLALETPADRFVEGPTGAGVIAPDGGSLAIVSHDRIHAWGGQEAERLLDDLLAGWRGLGRPDESRLELKVRYDE